MTGSSTSSTASGGAGTREGRRRGALAEAFNFRDLGGLPTVDGGRVGDGHIYRSDTLDHLTQADVDVLCDGLGVCNVIDLRAGIEGAGEPPAWVGGRPVRFASLPLSDEFDDWGVLDDEGRRTLLARKYQSYLAAAGHNVVAALRIIAENAGGRPTVVHCAVGKDRTGVVVAILLGLLGVEREAIVADYAETAHNMERMLERLKANPIYAERVRTNPLEVYRSDPHTMELFLTAIGERFGGVEAWALANGLTAAEIASLRRGLLEHGATSGGEST